MKNIEKLISKILYTIYCPLSPVDIRKKYNLPEKLELEVNLTKDGYFVLTSKDLPGLITEAKDGKELIEMFNDAVLTYFDVPKKEGNVVYGRLDIEGQGVFRIVNDKALQEA